MEQTVGATSSIVPDSSRPSMAQLPVASLALHPDPAQLPVAVPLSFWTCCENCKMEFQYQIEYQNHLLLCTNCNRTFLAKEILPDSRIEKTVKPVPRARKRSKHMSHTEKSRNTGKFQAKGYNGLQIGSVLSPTGNGDSMLARDQTQSQQLIDPVYANHKVSKDSNFQNLPPPQEIQKKASPEDVCAALIQIPDLTRQEIMSGFDILRCDNFEFRSLMALPIEMRKDWLLMQIVKK